MHKKKAVVARNNQLVETGANDSPNAVGDLYWPQRDGTGLVVDKANGRDYMRGGDSNRQERLSIIEEIVKRADDYLLNINSVFELLVGSEIETCCLHRTLCKNKALEFHDDAMVTSTDDGANEKKVLFKPFSGIRPSRFYDLLSISCSQTLPIALQGPMRPEGVASNQMAMHHMRIASHLKQFKTSVSLTFELHRSTLPICCGERAPSMYLP